MEAMSMEVMHVQASENCLCVTDQQTAHDDTYFNRVRFSNFKEVQDQLVL